MYNCTIFLQYTIRSEIYFLALTLHPFSLVNIHVSSKLIVKNFKSLTVGKINVVTT